MPNLPAIRKPEVSLGLGLGSAALTYGIYQFFLPKEIDTRAGKPGDEHVESARKQAAWLSAGIVSGVALLAKDMTILIIGGGTLVTIDWMTRYNSFVNPLSGRVDLNPFTVEGAPPSTPTTPEAAGYGELQAVM